MAMPANWACWQGSGSLETSSREVGLRGLVPFGDGIEEAADHPWLGEEGDSLHPARALGAFENINPKHHLEQLSPWGPAAVATFFAIVAQDAACG